MVMLFLDMVLIGPVGMVTRSLPNWLGWAECRTNSFWFLCMHAWVNACGRVCVCGYVIARTEKGGEGNFKARWELMMEKHNSKKHTVSRIRGNHG